MRVAVVADLDVTSWRPLGRIIDVLNADDTLITTGAQAWPAEQMVKQRRRGQRPDFECVRPETGRFDPDEALRQRDLTLLRRHQPHALVLIGGQGGELYPNLEALMESARSLGTLIYDVDEFVKERMR